MEKIILLYSDLEGTILRESDRKYDDTDMYKLLGELSKLQELMDAKVKMHIVSPVSQDQMTEILDQLDRNFMRFNRLHSEKIKKLDFIEGAGASAKEDFMMGSQEDFASKRFLRKMDSRIEPLKKSGKESDDNPAGYGKYNYVLNWTKMSQERYDVKMVIYCGNGRNDLAAMDYVNATKGGFIICPQNTRREAKAKTSLVGTKNDLQGIIEGLSNLNKLIEKRANPNLDAPSGDQR